LIGRLMQRKMVHDYQQIPYADFKLGRTKKGKPYFDQALCVNKSYPNFNFNVSHQGDFVVGGCEGEWLLGVDVMKVELRGNQKCQDFFRDMRTCFTKKEWETINSHTNPLESFYQHWCLKEGYIKAVGIGLGFELQQAEFHLDLKTNTAIVYINNVLRKDWHFELHYLPNQHVAAVAYGPPAEADDCSRGAGINMSHVIGSGVDTIPRVPFRILTLAELLENMPVSVNTQSTNKS